MSYIKQILDYFFKHDEISDNLKSRVYHRLVNPCKDMERDEALKQLWNEIDVDSSLEWEKSYDEVEATIHNKKKKTIYSLHYCMRIAAVWFFPFIMLCTSAYFYFNNEDMNEVDKLVPEISYVQYYAPAGKREQVILPDGSTVWLNSGSTLIFPSTFSTSDRGVYLMGEGFFDVAKDSLHPFVVNTHFMKLQVLGTTFNISAYPDDIQTKATLETGALKINIKNDTTKSYYLQPDNQLVYTPSLNKVEQFNVQASDYSDWRMGGLYFNNTKFGDVMSIIERTYGVKIHIRNSLYNEQKVYVHYNKNESLENIFHILKIMIPELDYKISENIVYIE